MRSEAEVNRAIDLYADTVRRICILHLKNFHDTEDIFQEVFLKCALSATVFENPVHEKTNTPMIFKQHFIFIFPHLVLIEQKYPIDSTRYWSRKLYSL